MGMKQIVSRRNFLRTSTAAVAAPAVIPSSALGFAGFTAPSERITVGMVGMGLIASAMHLRAILGRKDVQILAVCDVDSKKRDKAKQRIDSRYGNNDCADYNEYERILDRSDIDACFVTTPDHWHVPISLAALAAGKDVYVEKPMSLTVQEGRVLSDAVRRHGAVLQVGSQQRSDNSFGRAAEMVRNGWIGKVHTVNAQLGTFPKARVFPEQAIPGGFDYERWLGPTPWQPFHRDRVLGVYGGGWRCFWEYGSRKNGDWGAHHFDIIQWALGMDHSGPEFFFPKGYDEMGCQGYMYKNGPTVYRDMPQTKFGLMIEFQGENGTIGVSRGNELLTDPAALKNRILKPSEVHLRASEGHHDNFFKAMKTRRRTIADVEIGHRTATICHLSAISERLDRTLRWDPNTEEIIGDPEAGKWLGRPRRAPFTL